MAPAPVSPVGGGTLFLGSLSNEQWTADESAGTNYFRFGVGGSDADADDDAAAAAKSRNQWSALEQREAFNRSGRSIVRASNELDAALGGDVSATPTFVASSRSGDNDNDAMAEATTCGSDIMSECDIVSAVLSLQSEATAVTENFGNSSARARGAAAVTPENSPRQQGHGGAPRRKQKADNGAVRDGGATIPGARRGDDSRADPPRRRIGMCGVSPAVDDGIRESFQDVNATVHQILGTVRRFGPDELDAVGETFRDARYFVRDKVRLALRPALNCTSGANRDDDGDRYDVDVEMDEGNDLRRRGKRAQLSDSERKAQRRRRRWLAGAARAQEAEGEESMSMPVDVGFEAERMDMISPAEVKRMLV